MVVYAQPDTAMLGLISTAHCCAPHLQHQLWAQLLGTCPGRANTLLSRCRTLLSGVAQVDTAGKQKFSIHFVIRDIQNNMGKVCKFSASQPPFRVLGKKPFFYSRGINPAKANKILEVTCFLWCSVALLEQWSLEFFFFLPIWHFLKFRSGFFLKKISINFIKYGVVLVVLNHFIVAR